MMGNKKSFAEILGSLVAKTMVSCTAIVITSAVIAVSVKIVSLVIKWLF